MQASSNDRKNVCEPETEGEDSSFKPMTAQEAQEWRNRHPALPVWRVVWGQALAGLAAAGLAGLLTGSVQVALSAGYGALSVVVPAALFARGVLRRQPTAGAAMVSLFGWELVKIVMTVVMLAAAPRLIAGLSWLALLAGMVVAMKTYWVALLVRPSVRKTD